jgi:hypothetical protein
VWIPDFLPSFDAWLLCCCCKVSAVLKVRPLYPCLVWSTLTGAHAEYWSVRKQ